jgi:hypothetical protein
MIIYYLYVKTHKITGLKYLGQTTQDPFKYSGSGIYWKRHLKIHGIDHHTEIIQQCYIKSAIKEWGLYYSNLWSVVESNKWANLKPESGDGGTGCPGYKHTPEMIKHMSDIRIGVPLTESHKASMSKARMGFKWGTHTEETKERIRNQSHSDEYIQFLKTSRVGNGNPRADKTIYTFVHDSGITETCTRSDLRIKYNLNKNHMGTIITARGKSNGWSVV